MSIDRELWKKELLSHEEFFERIYDKLPRIFLYNRAVIIRLREVAGKVGTAG